MKSALRDHLGIRFVGVEPDGIRMSIEIGEDHHNHGGTLHGVVVTTMIDIACAVAIRAHLNQAPLGPEEPLPTDGSAIVTLTLNTSFVSAASEGTITAAARRRGGGQRIHFAAAELRDAAGRLIATAEGSYALRHRQKAPR